MIWKTALDELKEKLSAGDMRETAKLANWKVALAAEMKRRTTASNQWLSDALGMGNPFAVSRLAKECRSGKRSVRHLRQLEQTSKSKARCVIVMQLHKAKTGLCADNL